MDDTVAGFARRQNKTRAPNTSSCTITAPSQRSQHEEARVLITECCVVQKMTPITTARCGTIKKPSPTIPVDYLLLHPTLSLILNKALACTISEAGGKTKSRSPWRLKVDLRLNTAPCWNTATAVVQITFPRGEHNHFFLLLHPFEIVHTYIYIYI